MCETSIRLSFKKDVDLVIDLVVDKVEIRVE